MINLMKEKWGENSPKLKDSIFAKCINGWEPAEYSELLKLALSVIWNDCSYCYDDNTSRKFVNVDRITVIDDGAYQGEQIMIFPLNTYQPDTSDYFWTRVYYGSCSGCDALMYANVQSLEDQVHDLFMICKDLIAGIKPFYPTKHLKKEYQDSTWEENEEVKEKLDILDF